MGPILWVGNFNYMYFVKLSQVDLKSMSFEELIEIESTLDVGENDLVPVSIQDDEVCVAL